MVVKVGHAMKKLGIGFLWAIAAIYFVSLSVALVVAYRSKADWLVILGALWLGVFLGTLVGFYVQEADEWGPRALTTSIWVVAGSSTLVLLQFLNPSAGLREIWFYPLGIVGGFIVGTIWEYVDPPLPSK
ncbi:hypothetical protein [Bradyrhizobium manausense]|uniref:Uncharacterized protein n=1 Tax=Bradyrhizobium manausense TaxID=989370 RepID=A0A0R3DN54_9BRAD|nr:hypothetical protein [Bradyrhizobium manausense]KRQ09156.1 hypothetical protein AOQ71_21235 [Bradyrhizobium manausense]